MYVIAHRGASAWAPENTVAAFDLAFEAGADGLEFDVRLAKDGVPVVIHDATLERTAGEKRFVRDITSRELTRIEVAAQVPKQMKAYAASYRIPSLEQTLEIAGRFTGPIYVEIKVDAADERKRLVDSVAGILAVYRPLEQLIVKSFDLNLLHLIKTRLPAVSTAALFEPTAAAIFGRRRRMIEKATEAGAEHLSVHRALATAGLVRSASTAGLAVTVWTVDDPRWLQRPLAREIFALITNDPGAMLHRA